MKKYYQKKRLDISIKDQYREHSESFSADQIADILGVTIQTAYKYLKSQHAIEPSKIELLEIKGLGKIPFPGWDGYFFDRTGNLIARNGYSINAEEIANFTFIKQLNSALKIENENLKAQVRELQKAQNSQSNVVWLKNPA